MNYATLEQLATIGLSSKALNGIPIARQQLALQTASDVVSGYLNRVFTLPLTQFGLDVTRATCVLAAYDLRVSLGFNPAPGSSDEELRLRVEQTTQWLRDVAKGLVRPVGIVDSGVVVSGGSNGGAAVAISDPPRGW